KMAWRFLRKLKIELSYDSAIVLLGIYPKNTKALIQRDICFSMFIAALCTIANVWKQPKGPSVAEWVKKMYMPKNITHTEKKDKMLPFPITWIKLENISQSEKDNYHMISLRCGG
ncbi:LORF2 protein, partial [Crocuta crocuta]